MYTHTHPHRHVVAHLIIFDDAFCSEQSHIGLMGPVRTKILVTLVTQFGGELRNGKVS